MSGQSHVGSGGIYEAGDQRNVPQSQLEERERYKEGQPNSHKANDPKDERSIANKLAREEKREKEPDAGKPNAGEKRFETPTSKGMKIDQEIEQEIQEEMEKKGKGTFGPK